MGSVSLNIGDGTARFRRSTLCPSFVHLIMLLSVLVTNLFALYAFTSSPPKPHHPGPTTTIHPELTAQISSIHREISLSERRLRHIELDLAGYPSLDPTSPSLPTELKVFLSRHPLPLGPDSRSAITHLLSSVAHTCARAPDLLSQFSSYTPHSFCPSADLPSLPLKLVSLHCDPLPRRRCLSRSNSRSHLISSLPSLRSKNGFPLSTVLAIAPIRIGLDINADSTEFAAAVSSHNATIVTTSSAEIHTEGLLSLLISAKQRLPFYDNIFDLVRVAKGLDEGGEEMEFWMFDVDRVVRPGGLLWFDNYCFGDDERKRGLTRLIEKFGYKKVKWVVGEKGGKVYLSAVLKKPVRA